MEEQQDTVQILKELGYKIKKVGSTIQANAAYRGGDTVGSLTVYENGVYDWVQCRALTLKDLVKIGISADSDDKVDEWLKNKNFTIRVKQDKPKISSPTVYPVEMLDKLLPQHDYFIKRGISKETLIEFRGGVAMSKGKLQHRYVLPIFDGKGLLIGFTGRALNDEMKPKYLHIGPKNTFIYPAFLNYKIIKKEKRVILTESPACILRLWSEGVKNTLCLFGINISKEQISYLIKMSPDKIYISTNNEPDNHSRGNDAAVKIEEKLLNYFDRGQVEIKLPQKKDFGNCTSEEILQFKKEIT